MNTLPDDATRADPAHASRQCPKCHLGSYADLKCRSFKAHFRQCKGNKHKDREREETADNGTPESAGVPLSDKEPIYCVDRDTIRHPEYLSRLTHLAHPTLENRDNYADEPFDFNSDNHNDPFDVECNDMSEGESTLPPHEPKAANGDPFNRNAPLPQSTGFQTELHELLTRHGSHLTLHDELVQLLNAHLHNGSIDETTTLKSRETFLKLCTETFNAKNLQPKHVPVKLHNGMHATVSVFDIEAMILSLLSDEELMQPENLAEGYDIFTGAVDENHPDNDKYGEVHTGDAWKPAVMHFCGPDGKIMPIAIIVFGDKSHTDLHGSLSVTPVIFTLTLFNSKARNQPRFWRPIAYLPNLSHGKGESDNTKSTDKVRDEHACLGLAFQGLLNLTKNNPEGLRLCVLNRQVTAKVFVHFFIGDTEGNNKWCGHRQTRKRPYRDCKCCHARLDDVDPTCEYFSVRETRRSKRRKRDLEDQIAMSLKRKGDVEQELKTRFKRRRKLNAVEAEDKETLKMERENLKTKIDELKKETNTVFTDISKHDVKVVFNDPLFPLSDVKYGIYRMMPPELLHTSGSGLIKYMFSTLKAMFGTRKRGKRHRRTIDALHRMINAEIDRQSDRDFPRAALRNGLLDGTKVGASEIRGNLHRLLCISYTVSGQEALRQVLEDHNLSFEQFRNFIRLYLAMEEWFHDSRPKDEVRHARRLIAKTLRALKRVFPRLAGDGFKVPKFHGMTKMQYYICLFGSGANFYGGPGESAHKVFVKGTGKVTSRKVNTFCSEVANRYFEHKIIDMAKDALSRQTTHSHVYIGQTQSSNLEEGYHGRGRYTVTVDSLSKRYKDGHSVDHSVHWHSKNKKKHKMPDRWAIHSDLLRVVYNDAKNRGVHGTFDFDGYTEMTIDLDSQGQHLFRSTPWYKKGEWYDWALVEFMNDDAYKRYPSRILGFVKLPWENSIMAVIQCTKRPLEWEQLQKAFVSPIELGTNLEREDYTCVHLDAIVSPLCVFENYGADRLQHFCILPRRCWSDYFGDNIDVSVDLADDNDGTVVDHPRRQRLQEIQEDQDGSAVEYDENDDNSGTEEEDSEDDR